MLPRRPSSPLGAHPWKRAFCVEEPPIVAREVTPPGVWRYSALESRFPNLSEGLQPIIATLVRHGMIDGGGLAATRDDGVADPVWSISTFGVKVHAYLQQDTDIGAVVADHA